MILHVCKLKKKIEFFSGRVSGHPPPPATRMIAQRVLYVEQNLIFRHMNISLRGRNELLNTEIEVHKI